ncbi:Aste57867_23599 [Aphanomyces stellatus]|uniref:Aste57867_23599 protein n=1 Tax=Aphanomyces stellatus TaxID=120398 RepID=A0A485LN29_9STRA|nr:hypothetical protein As57867_023527 [Aphanomyces stellatus]VFU00244.1 Aste57867_23599 [Aphanomyces stellatus]
MPPCVLVLCGLPGGGKSTLSRRFAAHFCTYSVECFCYDDLFVDAAASSPDQPFRPDEWRALRASVLEKLDQRLLALQDTTSTQHILVLDDNMYYRSMRKRVFRLALQRQASFGQVHVSTSIETCRRRNEQRAMPVPPMVFDRMAALMEPPDATRFPWETHSIQVTLDSEHESDAAIMRICEFVDLIAQHPEWPRDTSAEELEKATWTLATIASLSTDE